MLFSFILFFSLINADTINVDPVNGDDENCNNGQVACQHIETAFGLVKDNTRITLIDGSYVEENGASLQDFTNVTVSGEGNLSLVNGLIQNTFTTFSFKNVNQLNLSNFAVQSTSAGFVVIINSTGVILKNLYFNQNELPSLFVSPFQLIGCKDIIFTIDNAFSVASNV